MIAAPFSWEQPAPSYQHASAQAYAAFLREYLGESRSVPFYLRMREQFIQAYPDLQTWFAAPLIERVGRVSGESDHALHMVHRPSYLARAYLYYLVLTGSIRFDWDWLLPIHLDIWKMLAHFHLDLGLPTLLEEAVKLGYSRPSATQSLKWVLCRVFLHEPYTVLSPRVGAGALELIEPTRCATS
jgi:hypothetical protein